MIHRIKNGEKVLYAEIVRRYNPLLYKIGRSYNFNHEDTEGLMQDTYLDAYKGIEKFKGESKFKTWIVRIMLNNCYHKRMNFDKKNEISADINEEITPNFSNGTNTTDRLLDNEELHYIIEDALSSIPQEYRMVFSLREISGFNTIETANILEISESNVKVRLHRAKEMLKSEITKTYTASELFSFNLVYCEPLTHRVMQQVHEL